MYKLNYMLPVLIGAPDMADTKIFNISLIQKGEPKLLRLFPNYSSSSNSHKPQLSPMIKYTKQSLGSYLAGLIEGDGYITITNKDSVILGITFNLKDKPLAEKLLRILGGGFIVKRKTNSVELRFSHKQTLCQIIELINGKFRTPKIEALHRLIHWLNEYNKFERLDLLSLDNSNLLSNAWLAGFSDCDSNFLVTFTTQSGIAKNIQLTYRLSQRQNYHRASEFGTSYLPILTKISQSFNTKLVSFERSRINVNTKYSFIELGYLVTVKSLSSRNELIKYFSRFSLLSSKRLDYLDWVESHELVLSKKHKTIEGTSKLIELKNSMNTKRSYFNWDHLDAYNK